jgi:hypothetical protein
VDPANAFREIQLILKYDPFVSEELKGAPIDVDVTVGTSVEVAETNSTTSHSDYQQFRQVEVKEVKLFAGHHCIGIGKGSTELLATQEASIHALLNYYLRQGPVFDVEVDRRSQPPANRDDDPLTKAYDTNDDAPPSFDMMDVILGVGSSEEELPVAAESQASPRIAEASYFF